MDNWVWNDKFQPSALFGVLYFLTWANNGNITKHLVFFNINEGSF